MSASFRTSLTGTAEVVSQGFLVPLLRGTGRESQ